MFLLISLLLVFCHLHVFMLFWLLSWAALSGIRRMRWWTGLLAAIPLAFLVFAGFGFAIQFKYPTLWGAGICVARWNP